jgi:solute carrier family 6 amino acid transporter-like protein 5/7/9/14
MLMTLGIGTNVAQMACFMTIIRDKFPKVKHWHAALLIAVVFILIGSVYLTPVNQHFR